MIFKKRLAFLICGALLALFTSTSMAVTVLASGPYLFPLQNVGGYVNTPVIQGNVILQNTVDLPVGSQAYRTGVGVINIPTASQTGNLQWGLLACSPEAPAPLNIGVQTGSGDENNLSLGSQFNPSLTISGTFSWVSSSPVTVTNGKPLAYFYIPGALGKHIAVNTLILGNPADVSSYISGHPATGAPCDITAPVLTVPTSPVVVEATGPSGAPVSFNVSATDETPVTPVCTIGSSSTVVASGSSFLFGNTVVDCIAKDASGNMTTKSFIVTVHDTTAPKITAVATPSSIWPPNHKMVTVNVAVSVTDSGSGPAGFVLLSATASGSASDIQGFVVGTASVSGTVRANKDEIYTLTYQGKDKVGNSAMVVVTVKVAHEQENQNSPDDQGTQNDQNQQS